MNTVEGRQVGERTYRLKVERTPSGYSRPCREVLWELEKAFDEVPRNVAVVRLLALGYPKLHCEI